MPKGPYLMSRDSLAESVNLILYSCVDSSRFGSVGEVSIDFASYAEATKLSSLSLPLINANSGAVLHVGPFFLSIFYGN
ncbi:hypothetical protein HanXRQr2_Chr02g0068391 [Helianthus annuus]|uniref:Uncharacterized protein n=1 Tax=Helianthus annuus TaxID=4232 RepID=A0A9K3JPD7_HELAN|nr:hypothetical protein HanXRQr2_Chr02g0068391 [Helianthus annuus]